MTMLQSFLYLSICSSIQSVFHKSSVLDIMFILRVLKSGKKVFSYEFVPFLLNTLTRSLCKILSILFNITLDMIYFSVETDHTDTVEFLFKLSRCSFFILFFGDWIVLKIYQCFFVFRWKKVPFSHVPLTS